MSIASTRILIVGDLLPGTGEILRRLSNRGYGSRHVKTLREARDILGTFDFHVVLATELLPDGRGYDLAEPVSRHSRTLIVGVALTESCLWLPVIYRGVQVLGKRALSAEMLSDELDAMLAMQTGAQLRDGVREFARPSTIIPPRPALQRAAAPIRRKFRDRDKEHAEA
jgi:PleD family two-component response regulator